MTSTIKVNNVQNQCGANIINESSNTITIGASGDTVTLASGASQSGFGRSGSVDWQTGSIKTGDFTATSGEGYFVNTTSGAITVTLPASPSAGAIVAVSDYAKTFNTNACTIGRNSSNIEGAASNITLDAEGIAMTFVYADATKGWKVVGAGKESDRTAPAFVTATGGTITTCGNFKIHSFTGPGTFEVTCAGNCAGSTTISYLVVAGGGGGGNAGGAGGGGAGGFRESESPTCSYTQSPLAASGGLPVSVASYPVAVGGGGAYSPSTSAKGTSGVNSVFTGSSTITSAGGGGGGSACGPVQTGAAGGSGGGGSGHTDPASPGGAGNTPPVSPPQGTAGGTAPCGMSGTGCRYGGGGGGGATVAGTNASVPPSAIVAGPGGAGATTHITGSPVVYAGGGGGGIQAEVTGGNAVGTGGAGGGGNGGAKPTVAGTNGTANTGGGGGAGGQPGSTAGGNGGSGIVIIRYKFQ